jgi:hypothetical protein
MYLTTARVVDRRGAVHDAATPPDEEIDRTRAFPPLGVPAFHAARRTCGARSVRATCLDGGQVRGRPALSSGVRGVGSPTGCPPGSGVAREWIAARRAPTCGEWLERGLPGSK